MTERGNWYPMGLAVGWFWITIGCVMLFGAGALLLGMGIPLVLYCGWQLGKRESPNQQQRPMRDITNKADWI